MSESMPPNTREEWKVLIKAQQESRLSIRQWCQEKGISSSAFYYWKKKLSIQKPLTRSSFTEIIEQQQKAVVIEYQDMRIILERGFDPEVLKSCLEMLRKTPF